MSEEMIQIFKSQKGGNKLLREGFTYDLNYKYKEKWYWNCEYKKNVVYKCKARLVTNCFMTVKDVSISSSSGEHNHEVDPVRAEVAEVIHDLKSKTRSQPTVKTCQILQNHLASTSTGIGSHLPSKSSLTQIISREKKKILNIPAEPTSFDFVIDHDKCTFNDERFVIKEKIFGECKRVILCSTKQLMLCLSAADYWLMDGTFKIAPVIFQQLYTIHGSISGSDKTFPLLFVLCTHKDKSSYDVMFDLIKEYCADNEININPLYVIMDFEKAPALSLRQNYENVVVKGCFFHLRQIIYRKIQKDGLSSTYNNDQSFNSDIKCLLALCYIHPANVRMYYNDLVTTWANNNSNINNSSNNNSLTIAQWFGENYIIGKNNQQPKYSPEFWCLSNVPNNIPRTQNSAESFHHHINGVCSKRHVGFYRLIAELIKETKVNVLQIDKIRNGEPERKKKKTKNSYKHSKIQNILRNITDYTNMELLRAIASNL